MYWHKKKLDYNILIPPLNKPFKKFTQKEAENYFIWHKNQLNRSGSPPYRFCGSRAPDTCPRQTFPCGRACGTDD